MAQVVIGGTREFDYALSGEPHPNTLNYLRNQVESAGQYLGPAATAWVAQVQSSFNQFASEDALRFARAAVRKTSNFFQADNIRPLSTLHEFQQAPVKMQRFLMANPPIREMYLEQRLDGYSGSYVDVWPGAVGDNHYDFRRVMQGVVKEVPVTEDSEDDNWMFTTYLDEVCEGDRELTLVEQTDILTSWERMNALMGSALDDPTSATGGLL